MTYNVRVKFKLPNGTIIIHYFNTDNADAIRRKATRAVSEFYEEFEILKIDLGEFVEEDECNS